MIMIMIMVMIMIMIMIMIMVMVMIMIMIMIMIIVIIFSVRKMEAEVVRMVVNLFHGDEQCCGLVSTLRRNVICYHI